MIIKVYVNFHTKVKGDLKNGITIENLKTKVPSAIFTTCKYYPDSFFGEFFDEEVFEYDSMAEYMVKFDKDVEEYYDKYLNKKLGEYNDAVWCGIYLKQFEIEKIEGKEENGSC